MNKNPFGGAQPMIPEVLLHTMHEIQSGSRFDQANGGQWTPGEERRIAFKGVVLPVSDKDLVRDTAGTYVKCTEKVYTNGKKKKHGAQIEDFDGSRYTVTQELGHNSLHPIKRYLIERKEGAAPR